jgi:regulatory protein
MELRVAITNYCKYQERCHSEVRNKLLELGCRGEEVEEYISEMIAGGFLNEERYAKAYARGKFRMKHWGQVKIRQQLKLKKVSDYCIKKGLAEIDADEYLAMATKTVEKKWVELKSERSVVKRKGKVYRYAVQKGYESDITLEILNEIVKKGQ